MALTWIGIWQMTGCRFTQHRVVHLKTRIPTG